MRSTAHVNDHPIHPMIIPFPFAYLFGSACIDAWASATNRSRWFRTASHLNALGIATALAAAIPGLIDYVFSVPPKSSAKQRATNHMFANVSALGLFALARIGRRDDERPAPWAVAAELCGLGLISTGGYLGGTLVYRNQIGVDHRYANAGRWNEQPLPPATEPLVEAPAADELAVDQMKLLRIGSRRIVVARTERGFVAFDDRCTHKGGPLSDGALVCGIVQCPWHGSQFDAATGAVKQGPAAERITTYEVIEKEGKVFVAVGGHAG